MFQIDPFKLSHLPLDFHPSKPFKTKVVLLCRICQLQSIRRSNKSRTCGQCQHGYNLTQGTIEFDPWDINLQKLPRKCVRRLETFQVLVYFQKSWATPVGFNQKNAWVVDVCRILDGILEAMPIVPPRVPTVPKWMPSDPNHTATSGARQDHAQDSSKDHRCLFQGVG